MKTIPNKVICKNAFKKIHFLLGIFSLLGFLYGCSNIQAIKGIEMLKGKSRFNHELAQLENPRGVLPSGAAALSSNESFISKDPAGWHEFFVYDEFNTLVILSVTPRYFIKIESNQFFHHVDTEYDQIKEGLSGPDKEVSSFDFVNQVGDFDVGLLFTPKELRYNTSNRIVHAKEQPKPRELPWHLLEAANEVVAYLPIFEERQLFSDMQTQAEEGLSRIIYTKDSPIPALGSKHVINHPAEFSFIMGKDLRKTKNLVDKGLLFPDDEFKLIRDFIIFFSAPLGDTAYASDFILDRDITQNFCVVLSNSSTQPTAVNSAGVIDFAAFGTSTVMGEGGMNAPSLSDEQSLRRKGNCQYQDTDDNMADFIRFDTSLSDNPRIPQNNLSPACIPTAPLPTVPIVISEIGNKFIDITANDYIVLYNTTPNSISLQDYYIGLDTSCKIAGANDDWLEYEPLPPDEEIKAHGYYMISRPNHEFKKYLNTRDSMAILYRGNLSRFERFLTKDRFDLKNRGAGL